MLKYRVLSALVLIPLVLIWLWWFPRWAFVGLLLVFLVIAADEWAQLIGCRQWSERVWMVLAALGCVGLMAWIPPLWVAGVGVAVVLVAIGHVLWYQRTGRFAWLSSPTVRVLLGLFLLSAFWQALMQLRFHQVLGPHWILYVFVMIWISDSAAYTAGRRWGRSRLASRVSPNKSWEGVWAGLIMGLVLAFMASFALPITLASQRWKLMVVMLVTLVVAIFGDLFESVVKRQAGVKDSGRLIPGHGGLLDRVDSLLTALIVYELGLLWVMS